MWSKRAEVAHEQRFGAACILVAAAVRQRLAAAGLIQRIHDVEPKRSSSSSVATATSGNKRIDVARDEEPDLHDGAFRCRRAVPLTHDHRRERPAGTPVPSRAVP